MTHKISLVAVIALMVSLTACEGASEGEQTAAGDDAAQQQMAAADTASQDLPTTSHPENTQDWQRLFSPDLSNAVLENPDSWVMEEGVLQANDHSTIWTEGSSYEDFVLDLEFRTPEGANSGIFIRPSSRENILSALEVQVHDSTDGGPRGQVGAIYDLKSPSKDVDKPAGQWERFTITANDNKIYVVHNGQQVIDMNLNRWTEAGMNPDGTENKFDRVIKNQVEGGPIGIQGIHGGGGQPVLYRNIRIKRLEE